MSIEKRSPNPVLEAGADDGVIGDGLMILGDNPIESYLEQIKKIPRLRRVEEKALFKSIEIGRNIKDALENGEDIIKEDISLIEIGERATEKVVKANLRSVVTKVDRYKDHGVSFEDLIEEGTIGLIKAIDKFDHTGDYRFSRYVGYSIEKEIKKAVIDYKNSDETRDLRLMEDKKYSNPEKLVEAQLQKEVLISMFSEIHPRWRRVLELRFPFEDDEKWTYEEIGREFGLSRERIRQVESNILRRFGSAKQFEKYRKLLGRCKVKSFYEVNL